MIAMPGQFARDFTPHLKLHPVDTGCVFPHGRSGDVRVYLLTDDDSLAERFGDLLAEWGLPRVRKFIVTPSITTMPVFNPFGNMVIHPLTKQKIPEPLRYRGKWIFVETKSWDDMMAFSKWMCEKYEIHERKRAIAAAKKAPSLAQLADAGEIETFDAG